MFIFSIRPVSTGEHKVRPCLALLFECESVFTLFNRQTNPRGLHVQEGGLQVRVGDGLDEIR
jgi:hypothetical protein